MRAVAIIAALLLVTGGAVTWRLRAKGLEAGAQAQQRMARSGSAPSVAVGAIERRDIVKRIEAVGTIEAPTHVKVAAKLTGRIATLTVEEGDRVAAGQVLVRLEAPELEALVRSQQARVAESLAKLAQAELGQNPADVTSRSAIRQQEAAVAGARADNEQARRTVQAQVAAAEASLTDAQAKIDNAAAAVAGAEAGVRSAQANLANARARHNRMADLFKQGFISAQDVDDARTAQEVQAGAVEVATGQVNVSRAQLRSAHALAETARQNASIVAGKGQADIAASDAKLQQAQAALDAARANTAVPAAFRRGIEATRAALAADQAALRNSQAQLANAVLVAPVGGVVTARLLDQGSLATVGATILEVQAVREVWATAPVPEEAAVRLAPGQAGEVTVGAWPGRRFLGKVTQVNGASDAASRQVTVRVALDNADGALRAGMFATVTLVTERLDQVLVAPREAVQRGKGGPALAVLGPDMKVTLTPIRTGAADAAGVQVVGAVRPGDRVVTLAGAPLKDGQAVRLGGKRPNRGGGR